MASAGRIKRKFREMRARGEAALVPFVVAGDPDLDTTRRLILELEKRGADLIEIGVPFSDPMADGPANQRSLARGLGAGASIAAILSMVSEIRSETEIPIILYGYYNPIFHYGCEQMCADAARAGVDALLVVDLPMRVRMGSTVSNCSRRRLRLSGAAKSRAPRAAFSTMSR